MCVCIHSGVEEAGSEEMMSLVQEVCVCVCIHSGVEEAGSEEMTGLVQEVCVCIQVWRRRAVKR